MKKKKFPSDVARLFNPHKSGTNADNEVTGGTHQDEKRKERSYIPVY